ncbi:pro-sigmaK processing inhibitor BofA family protein [Sulfobacillus sp. hq2]|uniref:pro-sigmaK processing inhibitor BofA family protein n=1 Tax=Sulfobacillus sp. hq2 TaxID=2039167 RepID=UPI000CD0FD42|nr:pro-sigmaK processing inhibitor BofA family protein [Sulfobacillus sp. hq2]POB12119.1 hypothetical protein CO251_01535 [Sulfobacillus sp. hq2]
MDPRIVIALLFGALMVYIVVTSLAQPVGWAKPVLIRALGGLALLKVYDLAAVHLGWLPIGFNLMSAVVAGILGVPGFAALIAIRYGISGM